LASANPSGLVKDSGTACEHVDECVDEIYLRHTQDSLLSPWPAQPKMIEDIFHDAQRATCTWKNVAKNQQANECLALSHAVQVVAPLSIMSWIMSM
jgi:hypothetical protein